MSTSAPASYATADQARGYVMSVLRRPRPEGRPARVYLIVQPGLRKAKAWAAILPALAAKLPGAEFLDYADVFGDRWTTVEQRVPKIAEAADGALVVPSAWRDVSVPKPYPVRYLLGYAAQAEARALVGLGRPVLVFTPAGLVGWPDIRTRAAADPHPKWLTLELELPQPPPGLLLPTVAASLQALALPRPSAPRRQPRQAPARPQSHAPARELAEASR